MGTDLAALCRDMVAIPSVSQREKSLADFVVEYLGGVKGLDTTRIGNNVVARSSFGRQYRILIAGHLDTVPPDDNLVPLVRDGRIYGLGSADMKSGLAVMLGLADQVTSFSMDVTFIFYVCEEAVASLSGLKEIERSDEEIFASQAAILMEPTSSRIEAGCQGTMRIRCDIRGKRAHTARPWVGVNAIHRLGELVQRISNAELEDPVIDGLQFREALQVVKISGGVANNVVPDLASIVVNHRFAPDKGIEEAFQSVRRLLGDLIDQDNGDEVVLEEGVLGAMPNLDSPFIAKLLEITGEMPKAKLGWTDVAFFSARGIPATNFGPGDPLVAHTKDEFVEVKEIDLAFNAMNYALRV